MPNYDMRCPTCDIVYPDCVMSYETAKSEKCPICETQLDILPGRFAFRVTGSKVAERQKLEARFKRRAARIEREMTPAQADRFDNWCRKHGCKRSY